jgi:anion-transporting  ArsA/GET3 family ATPase
MSLKLISGKGGVGKTYITALMHMKNPQSILFDCSGDLVSQLQTLRQPLAPIRLKDDSEIIRMTLKRIVKINKIAVWAAEHKMIQNLFRLAPNLLEFLLLLHIVEMAEASSQDIVVDAPSTGNFLGLLKSVKSANRMFDAGLMKQNAARIFNFLNNPSKTEFFLVSLAEKSALDEMIELENQILQIFPTSKVQRVLNRKHEVITNWESLPKELHFLAHDRPLSEDRRLQGIEFHKTVKEGDLHID